MMASNVHFGVSVSLGDSLDNMEPLWRLGRNVWGSIHILDHVHIVTWTSYMGIQVLQQCSLHTYTSSIDTEYSSQHGW